MTNSLKLNTVSITDDVQILVPYSHLGFFSIINGISWCKDNENIFGDDDPGTPEEILATVYISEVLPESVTHDDFDAMAFMSRLSELILEDPELYQKADEILSASMMEEMISVQQVVSLAEIKGLTDKYRHSHTLRRDFINKYSVLYPVACSYLRECKPEKTNRTVHRPWMGMDGMDESALYVFLNGYTAFAEKLSADLSAPSNH